MDGSDTRHLQDVQEEKAVPAGGQNAGLTEVIIIVVYVLLVLFTVSILFPQVSVSPNDQPGAEPLPGVHERL